MTLSPSSTTYCYQSWIPFHLTDPAGILFFGHVFTLFHQAFEHFIIHQLKWPWTLWFQNPDWIVPIKHAEAQYFLPLLPGEECQIELSVTTLSTTSFTLNASFYQKQLCCQLKTVHVFCHPLTKQKIPIPLSLRPILQELLPL